MATKIVSGNTYPAVNGGVKGISTDPRFLIQGGVAIAPTEDFFFVEFSLDDPFDVAPAVVITPQQDDGQVNAPPSTYIAKIQTDGFLMFSDGRATGYNIQWMAIGRKASLNK